MYYLHHYFDPDLNYKRLTPKLGPGGTTNTRYLGYVQNVVRGQVLAELVDLESFSVAERDPRFVLKKPYLPVGPNCALHESNPNKIVAASNGYVFYNQGLISVKNLLNIRGDLNFATGNVFFVGDVVVHGDVQTGFSLQGRNVMVKGHIMRSKITAVHDLVCLNGIRGGSVSADFRPDKDFVANWEPVALLETGGNLRLRFCEHANILARGNVIIEDSCLHSTIYVGGNLVVKGRLQGGTVVAGGLVYVGERLGSDFGERTRVLLEQDPFEYKQLRDNADMIAYLEDCAASFEYRMLTNKESAAYYSQRIMLAERMLKSLISKNRELWDKFDMDSDPVAARKLVVNGKIMPGCEIFFGGSNYRTCETDSALTFLLQDGRVTARHTYDSPIPAKEHPDTDTLQNGIFQN
ncbi:MAG: FapA family protein [Desulfovibrio sp.]|jgi:uncharacterized protein (DUF342 family)|nr:FapA family protein [Desulfovibrio sp.]